MGLSGARQKQRIPDDPRNTRWANDTAAPGFKMLSQMGWTKDTVLGNATSQSLIADGGSQVGLSTRKKVSVIPTAKSDKVGIGAGRTTGGVGIGGLRAMGTAMMGMGFVGATEGGSGASTPSSATAAPAQGGEFGRLLERLNAAKEKAAAEAAAEGGATEETKAEVKELSEKEQKKLRKAEKKRKREAEGEEGEVEAGKVAVVETVTTTTTTTTTVAVPILKNPRMAARSKHLRAKRMATANNAAAMAEILGLAPPGSTPLEAVTPVYTTPSTSGMSTPSFSATSGGLTASTSLPLQINGPTGDNGWPKVPPRSKMGMASMFAPSTIGGLESTFGNAKADEATEDPEAAPAPAKSAFGGGLGSMFAKASSGGLGATFAPSSTGGIGATRVEEAAPVVAEASTSAAPEDVEMDDEAKAKADARAKRIAKKEAGKVKKAAWLAAKAGGAAAPAPVEEEKEEATPVAAVVVVEEEVAPAAADEDAARKEAKRARKAEKEAKKARKAAKKAKKAASSDSDSD